jgi:hypothetical protein
MRVRWYYWTQVLVWGIAANLSAAPDAAACSCVVPRFSTLQIGNGQIPENFGGVIWWTAGLAQSGFALERWNGSAFEPVPATITGGEYTMLAPETPWVAGERYRFGVSNPDGGIDVSEVEIVAELDTSQPLALSAQGPVQRELVIPAPSPCGDVSPSVHVDVAVASPPESYDLLWTTRVDGNVYLPAVGGCGFQRPGTSWRGGRGTDRIGVACGDYRGTVFLKEGVHTVVLEARLPGTDTVWRSNELVVDLPCVPPPPAEGSAGSPMAAPTAGPVPTAEPEPTAKSVSNAEEAPANAALEPATEEGCAVRAGTATRQAGSAERRSALFGLALLGACRALSRRSRMR